MSKISKEELKELQEQEQKKNAIKHDIGVLETQKHSLLHVWADIISQQEGAKKELEEKYGKVNINLEDGSYEKIEEQKDVKIDKKNERKPNMLPNPTFVSKYNPNPIL